jgi:hypothetical protein
MKLKIVMIYLSKPALIILNNLKKKTIWLKFKE